MANNSLSEQFSLRWNNFPSNLSSGFFNHLTENDLVDVTLAVEGQLLQAHKLVLSVCSPYFKNIFKENPCQHPVIILKDMKYTEIESLLRFMYQGEVHIKQEDLSTFLKVAQTLQLRGLATEDTNNAELFSNCSNQLNVDSSTQSIAQSHLSSISKSSKDVEMMDRRKRSRDITKRNAKKIKQETGENIHGYSNEQADDDNQAASFLENRDTNNSEDEDQDTKVSIERNDDSDRIEEATDLIDGQSSRENPTQPELLCHYGQIAMGNFHEGASSKRGHQPTSDAEERLNGELHVLQPDPRGRHNDCAVCSNRKIKGGRKTTIYYCETCERKPFLHVGECFKKYHTLQTYK